MPSATSVPAVTGGGEDEVGRTCVRCQRPVPGDRSVCPSCGTLQPGLRQPGATGPADTARAAPAIAPRTIRATAPAAAPPTNVARSTTSRATGRRRSPLTAILAVLLIVACLVGIVVGAMYFDEKDAEDNAGDAPTTNAEEPADSDDPRPELVREYCDDPRQLTGPGQIAKFVPGTGTVAYVQLPQPASTTDEASEFAVQASPTVGDPNLSLDESINLVSMVVCVEQSASEAAGGTCDYELTNPDSIGESASAKLLETTFRVRLYELRTGAELAKGTVSTPTDRCPEFAFVDGTGVSNPLTEDLLLAWIAENLPNGQPR